MKKIFLVIIIAILITGCDNKKETEKNEYLAMKSNLLENKEFTSNENLNCEILTDIDKTNEETIEYNVTISNPKENMNNIKAIVVHNYYTEEVFPSVGLFNKKINLLTNNKENINLNGIIETKNDIDSLELELKVLIEYTTDDGKIKDIYYKTT